MSDFISVLVYLIVDILFVGVPIVGYVKLKDMPEAENDYSEWKGFYLAQFIVNLIYVVLPFMVMFSGFLSEKLALKVSSFFYGIQTFVYLALGIAGSVLYTNGQSNNVFGKGWNSETLDVVEDSYKCCFSYNGFARPDCVCQIESAYNTTERFGEVNYNISDIYANTTEIVNKNVDHDTNCKECYDKFFNVNDGFMISSIVIDFLNCCCSVGSAVLLKVGLSQRKKSEYEKLVNDDDEA